MPTAPGLTAQLQLLRCPACRSVFAASAPSPDDVDRLECAGCGGRWPVRFGIPDLRGDGVVDPYLSTDEDLRAAERLQVRAAAGGFADALAAYYETNDRVSAAQSRRFIAGALAAEGRSRAVLTTWESRSRRPTAGTTMFVDAGCGTGPLLIAAQAPNVTMVGVDVGLRWLVLAAARLRDRGAEAALVCAGANRLPFADGSVDVVASESLLENVTPAGPFLDESVRVLRRGGRLWLTTANRWSIGPDPHVGLPFGGWWPDRLVAAWAARRGMVPPRRQLLGAAALRAMLESRRLSDIAIGPVPIADSQFAEASSLIRNAVRGYRFTAKTTLGRLLLTSIGPSLLAVAEK